MTRATVASLPNYRWPVEWLARRYAPLRAAASGAFHLARAVGWVVSLLARRRPTIAVLRTDGVGDAILFEPVLRDLPRVFDGAEIHLWAPPPVIDLLRAHPAVKRFVAVPRGFKPGNHAVFWSIPWRARLGYRLGRFRYDLAIYPPADPEPLGNWLLASIRATQRWIADGSTLNQFDWQREIAQAGADSVLPVDRSPGIHELQRNAQLAASWESSVERLRPGIPASPRAATYAAVHLGAARHAVRRARARGLVGIIPAGSGELNRYPAARWAEVIRRLWTEHQLLSGLLGGPDDDDALSPIAKRLGDVPHHRFPADRDISVAAAVVARLDGVVSVDTGLAHAAAAFDVPSAVLVTGGMPWRFFPWPAATARTVAVNQPTPCAGCNYRCTHTDGAVCLTEVEPRQVVEALLAAMKLRPVAPALRIAPSGFPEEYRHAG